LHYILPFTNKNRSNFQNGFFICKDSAFARAKTGTNAPAFAKFQSVYRHCIILYIK